MLKFASLGSGSEGNALLIATSVDELDTMVMVDCGFGVRETERRLGRLGVQPEEIDAVLVTHEHADHVGGVFKFARRYKIPVWLSHGTYQAVQADCQGVDLHFCKDAIQVSIGSLQLTPYTVPHDAREPLQFVASNGTHKLGVLTDAGHVTPHMIAALGGCSGLVLECNHDLAMLSASTYPPSLKHRIAGQYGHLSNQSSSEILAALDQSRLRLVIGAHLSQANNTPELARAAISDALSSNEISVEIACQHAGFDWISI